MVLRVKLASLVDLFIRREWVWRIDVTMKNSSLLVTFAAACLGLSPMSVGAKSLTEFDKKSDGGLEWRVVDDGVMGGLSKGKVGMTDSGTMRFNGTLSLENNGGFSSIRTNSVSLDISDAEGLQMRVKGDGRSYQVRLSTDAKFRGMEMSFMAEFPTKKGKWTEVRVPFSQLEGTWRGRSLPDAKFDPSKVTRLGLLLADKKPGKFALEVDYVRTYGDKKKDGERGDKPVAKVDGESIAAIASGNKNFSTLVAAAKAAGLVDALAAKGPITVFAPTNEAFSKLPKGTIETLLKPENKERLQAVLKYHVVAGSVPLADALKAESGKTLEGTAVRVKFSKGKVMVNQANLLDADIKASNGVIHVIDAVLLPPEKVKKPERKTVVSVAKNAGSFKTLVAALKAAELDSVLSGKAPFTVFAPTDEAFSKLPKGTVSNLLKPENKDQLKAVLLYHVVAGKVAAGDALNAKTAETLNGAKVKFYVNDGMLKVNQANLKKVDVDGGNGVIHIIDQVLLPPDSNKNKKANTSHDKHANERMAKAAMAAIDKGVPMFNSGDEKGCANVYEECLVMMAKNNYLKSEVREKLAMVVRKGKHMNAEKRAWLYRHTLDGMIAMLTK